MNKDQRLEPCMMLTFPSSNGLRLLFIVVAIGLTIGCGPTPPSVSSTNTNSQFKVIGLLGARYLQEHKNRPPQKRADIVKYFEGIPEEWTGLGMSTAEEFLTSPRDGQPLVVVTGGEFGPLSPNGLPYIAYEQTGENGKIMLIDARGSVTEMPESDLRELFSKS